MDKTSCKLIFYIPHYAVIDESLIGVDYADFKEELLSCFVGIGVKAIVSQQKKTLLRDCEVDVTEVTIYCSPDHEQQIRNALHGFNIQVSQRIKARKISLCMG